MYNKKNMPNICWVEERRNKLDKNLFDGAGLICLPRNFDCIPHDLIMAEMTAYRIQIEYKSYLNNRKQCVNLSNTYSTFK